VRVLVVEDDFLVGQLIERILNAGNYEQVGRATNGLHVLELVQDTRPDVVFMDIEMPGIDGLEATRRIQELCPVPVVVMSAHDTAELVDRAASVGAGAYLTKPPESSQIERAVTIAVARFDDMMGNRRLREEAEARSRELQEALDHVKTLQGLIPICSSCKKVRDDDGYWQEVEVYVRAHTDAEFTHGLCPSCIVKFYPQYADKAEDR